jgi:hypothetical protein
MNFNARFRSPMDKNHPPHVWKRDLWADWGNYFGNEPDIDSKCIICKISIYEFIKYMETLEGFPKEKLEEFKNFDGKMLSHFFNLNFACLTNEELEIQDIIE